MSSYIDFWACKNKTSILIYYGTRNSDLYQFFCDSIPYGNTKNLSKEDINEYIIQLNEEITNLEGEIAKYNQKIDILKDSKVTACDLMKTVTEIQDFIKYQEEKIEAYKFLKHFCKIMVEIVDEESAEIWAGIDAPTPYKYNEEQNDEVK